MSYELPDLKTMGIFSAIAIPILTLFGVVYNRQSQANTASSYLLDQNSKFVTDALEKYVECLRKVDVDKEIIETVLREQDSDLSVLEEQVALEIIKMRSSVTVTGMTHFQNHPNTSKKPRSSRYSELLKEYKELFKTYPVLGLERLATNEAQTSLTLQMVEQAHENCEEHHAKFLGIAEELLSESGILIQRVKDIFKSSVSSISNKTNNVRGFSL